MKHAGTKTVETARLTLRALVPNDAAMMFCNWTSDENVTCFLRWDAHKSVEDTQKMVAKWVESYRQDSTYYWGMYLKNGEMIGSIGVTVTSEQDLKGELGYKLGSRWWNRGYATEAAKAVIDYMFRNTDIERLDAVYSAKNPASGRVMEKARMNCEGLLRHYYKTRDGFQDCYIYAMLREDWEKL